MNEKNQKLARDLFDIGAVKFGAFKLKLHETQPNAPLSPIYLNLRTANNPKPGPLSPKIVDEIGLSLYGLSYGYGFNFTHVVGVPRAGDPLAESLSNAAEKEKRVVRILHINKEEEKDRRQVGTLITGLYDAGDKVLLVDDLVTKADSKLEAIAALEKANLEVVGVTVLVDREQGGARQLRGAGYTLITVFTLPELLDYYVEIGYIDGNKRQEVLDYIVSNS